MKVFINGKNKELRKLIEDNAGNNYHVVADYLKSNGKWFYSYIQARKKNNLPYLSKNKIIWELINTVMDNKKSKNKADKEVDRYVKIYRDKGFSQHYEVNAYITKNGLWDEFSNIRSFNYHGEHEKIQGILPQYFAQVCEELSIAGAGGTPLDRAVSY